MRTSYINKDGKRLPTALFFLINGWVQNGKIVDMQK